MGACNDVRIEAGVRLVEEDLATAAPLISLAAISFQQIANRTSEQAEEGAGALSPRSKIETVGRKSALAVHLTLHE